MSKSIAAALALFSLATTVNMAGLAANVGTVSESNFTQEVLSARVPVVVDFYADWCGPCRRMGPVVEGLSADYAGKVKFVRVNVDSNQRLATQFRVSSIPTFGVFKNGKLVTSATGFMSKQQLGSTIEGVLR